MLTPHKAYSQCCCDGGIGSDIDIDLFNYHMGITEVVDVDPIDFSSERRG